MRIQFSILGSCQIAVVVLLIAFNSSCIRKQNQSKQLNEEKSEARLAAEAISELKRLRQISPPNDETLKCSFENVAQDLLSENLSSSSFLQRAKNRQKQCYFNVIEYSVLEGKVLYEADKPVLTFTENLPPVLLNFGFLEDCTEAGLVGKDGAVDFSELSVTELQVSMQKLSKIWELNQKGDQRFLSNLQIGLKEILKAAPKSRFEAVMFLSMFNVSSLPNDLPQAQNAIQEYSKAIFGIRDSLQGLMGHHSYELKFGHIPSNPKRIPTYQSEAEKVKELAAARKKQLDLQTRKVVPEIIFFADGNIRGYESSLYKLANLVRNTPAIFQEMQKFELLVLERTFQQRKKLKSIFQNQFSEFETNLVQRKLLVQRMLPDSTHLLLRVWENSLGYNYSRGGNPIENLRAIDANSFYQIIAKGETFSDTELVDSTGAESHGTLTHRLQLATVAQIWHPEIFDVSKKEDIEKFINIENFDDFKFVFPQKHTCGPDFPSSPQSFCHVYRSLAIGWFDGNLSGDLINKGILVDDNRNVWTALFDLPPNTRYPDTFSAPGFIKGLALRNLLGLGEFAQ